MPDEALRLGLGALATGSDGEASEVTFLFETLVPEGPVAGLGAGEGPEDPRRLRQEARAWPILTADDTPQNGHRGFPAQLKWLPKCRKPLAQRCCEAALAASGFAIW